MTLRADPDLRLQKHERLSSRAQLNLLFAQGGSFVAYPVRFVWMLTERDGPSPVRAAFSVSKRYWKRAVDRNLFKRRMREAYRAHKSLLLHTGIPEDRQIILACIYIPDKACAFDTINTGVKRGLKRIQAGITGTL